MTFASYVILKIYMKINSIIFFIVHYIITYIIYRKRDGSFSVIPSTASPQKMPLLSVQFRKYKFGFLFLSKIFWFLGAFVNYVRLEKRERGIINVHKLCTSFIDAPIHFCICLRTNLRCLKLLKKSKSCIHISGMVYTMVVKLVRDSTDTSELNIYR